MNDVSLFVRQGSPVRRGTCRDVFLAERGEGAHVTKVGDTLERSFVDVRCSGRVVGRFVDEPCERHRDAWIVGPFGDPFEAERAILPSPWPRRREESFDIAWVACLLDLVPERRAFRDRLRCDRGEPPRDLRGQEIDQIGDRRQALRSPRVEQRAKRIGFVIRREELDRS